MMRLLTCVVLSVLFSGLPAHAKVLGAIGANFNYQLAVNGRTYDLVQPLSVRAGYRFRFADVFGEYSYSRVSSGTTQVEVGTTSHEFLLWVRKGDPTARTIKPFVALGGGTHYVTVDTRFASETSRDSGAMELLGAVVGGVQFRLLKSVELSLEGRASFADSYSQSPLLGVGTYFNLVL